jgi:hypothetical protein
MKSILAMMAAISLTAVTGCAATQGKTDARAASVERKVTYETVVGAVQVYEPGQRIALVVSQNQIRVFQIDQGAEVVGSITVGRPAKVEFFKSSDGPERVLTIEETLSGAGR